LSGKAEWTELRIRTKLKAADLDAVLSELVKDGRISIISRGTQEANQALILLKPRMKSEAQASVAEGP
jgi:predicted methyltransferase MtxX (methanogen marker protein 4)